jgi:hypothetical protein
MKNLIQSKSFLFGFIIGILVFAAINLFSESVTSDYIRQFGFPFSFYEWRFGSNVGKVGSITLYDTVKVSKIIWSGLFANILFLLMFSFAAGKISKFVYSKISLRRVILK